MCVRVNITNVKFYCFIDIPVRHPMMVQRRQYRDLRMPTSIAGTAQPAFNGRQPADYRRVSLSNLRAGLKFD